MTNEEFQKKVNEFYQRNKYIELLDVVVATNGNHQCQLCGNRVLKRLCHIRNKERNEEWFIGWDCYSAVEELQEKEQKEKFKEIARCSNCGKKSMRGTLPPGAYAAGLCKQCWMEENNITPLATGMGMPEPIKEVK